MKNNPPTNNSTDYQKIIQDLKNGIASGTLKPGQRLVEAHLSRDFGVARSKIRQALRRLEQDGFVKIVPNVGAQVVEFSQRDVAHLYDLLSVLEGLAVRVITPFLTSEQLEHIGVLIKRVEEVSDKATQFFERNNELHAVLVRLTENDDLIKLAENLWFRIRCVNLQCVYSPGQMAAGVKEHRKMFEAMKEGRAAKAEQLMRDHLVNAKGRLLKYMNKTL